MLILCWLLAIVYFTAGIMALIRPDLVRRWYEWFNTPVRTRVSSALGIVLGLVLVYGRHATYWPTFVLIFGVVAVAASFVYLVLPWSLAQRTYRWSINISISRYRIYTILTMLVGLAFFRAAGIW